MIKLDTEKSRRLSFLKKMAKDQLEKLNEIDILKAVRRLNEKTYIDAQEKTGDELQTEIKLSILDKNKSNLLEFKNKQNLKNPT